MKQAGDTRVSVNNEMRAGLSGTLNRGWEMPTLVLSATLACAVIVGCGSKPKAEQNLVIAADSEIEGTDFQQTSWFALPQQLTCDPLVTHDLEFKNLVPCAAESFDFSADGLQMTFKLGKDAVFSSGNPMNAEAVKASFERFGKTSPYGDEFLSVKDFVIKDPQTLMFQLKKPAPFMLTPLAYPDGAPLDVKVANSMSKEDFNRKVVSNGLFTVKEWVQGSQLVLSKNPNHKSYLPFVTNNGTAKLDTVTIRFIPEAFTRVSELENGNVDILLSIPPESVKALKANPNLQTVEIVDPGMESIYVNTAKKPLDDLNIRTAIAIAINRDELVKTMDGTVMPRYGLLSPTQQCYDETIETTFKAKLGFDLEKAKSLIAQAGWKDTNGDGIVEKGGKPFQMELLITEGAKIAPMLQAQFKKLGIDLSLKTYEDSYVRQLLKTKKYDLALQYHSWPDPDILYSNFATQEKETPETMVLWRNPKSDKLLRDGRYTSDPAQRTKIYSEAQTIMLTELPLIPLYTNIFYMAYKKSIVGLKVAKDGMCFLHDVEKQ